MKAVLVIAAIALLAGCGSTRVVHVTDKQSAKRQAIRNHAPVSVVRGAFGGKAFRSFDSGPYHCEDFVADTNPAHPTVGAWLVRVCVRGTST